MDSSVFVGGSAIAAFAAGMIALFAPCCISVMLPAYFANSFRNRGVLVGMTLVFAAGIATIILPLAMGASALRQLFVTQHSLVYVTAGLLMLAMGLYTLAGGQMHLPVPGRRAGNRSGALSVYSLGVFSGVASSCCAPVLAGVVALASVAQSFIVALGLGALYVFGMVAPLFLISVLWDRFDWRSSWLFRQRQFTWRIGSVRRTISGSAVASGLLLTAMGAGTVWVGLAYEAMSASSGWQLQATILLQQYGRALADAFSSVPNWVAATVLLGSAVLLGWRAIMQLTAPPITGALHDNQQQISSRDDYGDSKQVREVEHS
ncbi:cytochrome c biogenesis CcdA family protein [Microvirga sp. VF16]|uniref:cytochrome c biogenesis CcdA family protein n=1 Tax=Microvirga sp. VF16 TaxID=2807101 RepID=UPI00193DF39A|nr:cytochrome c biogenesis CcdA family protein [Microvirga sp. VF16]QRM35299.1 cytochrome c biogenesis protein CcdA [Microvirga sp. VF16]